MLVGSSCRKLNKSFFPSFLISFLIITGLQAAQRKILSIEADSHIYYSEDGENVAINYLFKVRDYYSGEPAQQIELYKLRDLLIGNNANGTFQIVPGLDHYAVIKDSDHRMKVVISNMNKTRAGDYELVIYNEGGSVLKHKTSVIQKSPCTDELQEPLSHRALTGKRWWSSKIKSIHLCPPEKGTFVQGKYCVKNTDIPTEFRFAFDYYDRPESVKESVTGFVFYESNPDKWMKKKHIMGISLDGRYHRYSRRPYFKHAYTIAPYFVDDGIAFKMDFRNKSGCFKTYLSLTMRKQGAVNEFYRFVVKTDCHGNNCNKAPVTSIQEIDTGYGEVSTTPGHQSENPHDPLKHSGSTLQNQKALVLMATMLVSQLLM